MLSKCSIKEIIIANLHRFVKVANNDLVDIDIKNHAKHLFHSGNRDSATVVISYKDANERLGWSPTDQLKQYIKTLKIE